MDVLINCVRSSLIFKLGHYLPLCWFSVSLRLFVKYPNKQIETYCIVGTNLGQCYFRVGEKDQS